MLLLLFITSKFVITFYCIFLFQRKKQGKSVCCCYDDSKQTDTCITREHGCQCRCCGYNPLLVETEKVHKEHGIQNKSFEHENGTRSQNRNVQHNVPTRTKQERHFKQTVKDSSIGITQPSEIKDSETCETCSKCLQGTCDRTVCGELPCQKCQDSNIVC